MPQLPKPKTPANLVVPRVTRDDKVSYLGTKQELLDAGVAVEAMYPEPPQRRRWTNDVRENPVADRFAVTEKGQAKNETLFLVTREIGWEDPAAIERKHGEDQAERERDDVERELRGRLHMAENSTKRLDADLSDDAIDIAVGWSIASPGVKRHIKTVIDLYVSTRCPVLTDAYNRVSSVDQLRYERINERILLNLKRGRGDAA